MVDSTHRYMMERVAIDTIGAAMSYGQITEFRIDSVFRRSFVVLGNNLVPFGVLSIVVLAPQFVLQFFQVSLFGDTDSFEVLIAGLLSVALLWMLTYFLLSAVLMYGTIGELRGNRASIGQSIRWVLGLWFPILGVSIVATLGVTAGMLLLVVPGFILLTMWWVAVPAAVVERTGVAESLRRSAALTSGYRWRIFGMIMVLALLNGVVDSTLQMSSFGAAGTAAMAVHAVVSYMATAFFIAFGVPSEQNIIAALTVAGFLAMICSVLLSRSPQS